MSEMEMGRNQADLEALKALQADTSELERIESLLDRFNVFEAIGFVGQEVNHSHFLAFLLNPQQNHGLGDLFLKRLLREVLAATDTASLPILLEELDGMDLSQTLVRREHQHIDILLTNEAHKLAVVIENKIWTTEHSDQLNRYYEIVEDSHPGWQMLGIYLTPYGDAPSHKAYLPFSYGAVCKILDGILEGQGLSLSSDLRMSIEHYTDMLRRHIVGDSEIARLCQQIYHKHRRAFDLIYEHRPDIQTELKAELEALVDEEPRLVAVYSAKNRISFSVEGWDVPALRTADWPVSGRILLFEFFNRPNELQLKLMVGPGKDDVRQRLFDMATANPEVLKRPRKTDGPFGEIYARPFLDERLYGTDVSEAERTDEIRIRWAEFLKEDLPRIDAALKEERWIWESDESDEDDEGHSSSGSRFVWGEGDIVIHEPSEREE